jgi:hypothetical protein
MYRSLLAVATSCLFILYLAQHTFADEGESKIETIKPWVLDSSETTTNKAQPKKKTGIGELILKPGPQAIALLEEAGIDIGDKPNYFPQLRVERIGELGFRPDHSGIIYVDMTESALREGLYCELKTPYIEKDTILLTIDYLKNDVCHRYDVEIKIDLPNLIDVEHYLSVEQLQKSTVTWTYRGEVEWEDPKARAKREEKERKRE